MFYTSAGESHGRALSVIVSDVPAGLSIDAAAIDHDLARRQQGYGRGGRMAIERDHAQVISGVRFGHTIGSPIALMIENRDAAHWTAVMAADGEAPDDLVLEQAPRPGHADLVGALRNDTRDCRDILERASARETACRVAAGAVARALLGQVGVQVHSYVTRIGDAALPAGYPIPASAWDEVEASDVRCPDRDTAARMRDTIDAARAAGESLGGLVTVVVDGLVPGLGGYATASDRLTSRLGGALFSIPAIKGVGFGLGFDVASRPGSTVHDPIGYEEGRGFTRTSNNAGGLEGGMTNGQPLVMSVAMKPIPTLTTPLATVDLVTHEPRAASRERSDVCAVPACGVVCEAEVALVLADAYCTRFGAANMSDLTTALCAYRARLERA